MIKKVSIGAFVLLLFCMKAHAQMGNYWTLQVGTEGTLLSGALVAAKNNNSGFFYNPASMSSDQESSFAFNTSLFRSYFINQKNHFGPDTRLKYNTSNFDPIFLSFLVPSKNKLGLKLGLSLTGKQSSEYRVQDRLYKENFTFPNLDNSPGDYEGIYEYRLRSLEYWGNFSMSRKWNEKWSSGVTIIGAFRNFDYEHNELSNFVSTNIFGQSYTATFQNYTKAYMYNVKLMAKVGVIYAFNESSRIGLTATSQSFNLWGSGSMRRNLTQTNLGTLLLDTVNVAFDDQILSSYGENLKANHKSPLSIALGYNMERERYDLGVAVEYFHEIPKYELISGINNGELINTTPGTLSVEERDVLTLLYQQRSVINFALGLDYKIKENVTILGGVRTNFSTSVNQRFEDEPEENFVQDILVNYYHITGGSTVNILSNKFILGLDLAIGVNTNEPYLVNFSEPKVINNNGVPLRGDLENNSKTTHFMLGIVLGYSLQF